MTTAQSLLYAASNDITIGKLKALVGQLGGQETQTVEFKKNMAQTIARSVTAMANSYGGLILVGIDDSGVIEGVKGATADAVSSHCWEKIDPPWVPEVIPVPLGGGSDKFVLVMRVLPERCPRRPLMVDGAVYVRYNSTTRPASWYEARDLFTEPRDQHAESTWAIQAPQTPTRASADDLGVDFVLRSGIAVPIPAGTTGRTLSETAVAALATALDRSALAKVLGDFAGGPTGSADLQRFQRDGVNRARTARLAWWAVPVGWPTGISKPLAITVEVQAPGSYGLTNTHLQVTVDVTVRSGIPGATGQGFPWETGRFSPQELADLFDALLSTLTDADVTAALSVFAGSDVTAVTQPRVLHMICARQFKDVLGAFGLMSFPNAGSSGGGHVLAAPGLDLADPGDRHEQVRAWLTELALDAGLNGMEAVAAKLTFPAA